MMDFWKPAIKDVKEYRRRVTEDGELVRPHTFTAADVGRLLEIIEVQARALDQREDTIRGGWRVSATETKADQRRWRRLAQAATAQPIEWDYPL